MSNDSILDRESIESLRSITPGDNGEFLRELVGIFLHDTPVRIEEVRRSLAAKDLATLARAAHSMKGSAGNFGAMQFAEVNREIEVRVRDGKLEGLELLLLRLDAEFERVKTALLAEI